MVDLNYISKVIFIDFDDFLQKSIFNVKFNKVQGYPPYLCIRSILAALKRIEIDREDIVMIAESNGASWRSKHDNSYTTVEQNIKNKFKLNWIELDKAFENLRHSINSATPFHFYNGYQIEACDIIAYGVNYYKDKECIIISSNPIYDQLLSINNCKILSPRTKKLKVLLRTEKKLIRTVNKKTKTNLISSSLNKNAYENKFIINNLLTLPKEIQSLCNIIFDTLDNYKSYDINQFMFESLRTAIQDVYDNEKKKVVTYTDSFRKPIKITKSQTLDI